jgi:hypothetical protein
MVLSADFLTEVCYFEITSSGHPAAIIIHPVKQVLERRLICTI